MPHVNVGPAQPARPFVRTAFRVAAFKDLVDANRKLLEMITTGLVGHGNLRNDQSRTRQRNHHAGYQDRRLIRYDAVNVAGLVILRIQ